jgi:hypothetical protein
MPCVATTCLVSALALLRHAVRPDVSARRAAGHAACRRLLRLRRTSGCLGTSRGSSRGSSRRSSSTSSPTSRSGCPGTSRGSLLTSSPTSHVRVPRHVVRLVVDFFVYAAHLGASAPRTAHRAARRAARRRRRRLRRASGCLGTSHGSSRGSSHCSSSTTSTTPRVRVPQHVARLVVDNFAYAVRPGASAPRTAHHTARRAARRRLLRLRHVSGWLGTSRDSSRGSSWTTLTTTHPGASARRAARHVARRAACRRLLLLRRASGCLGTSRGSLATSSPTPRVRVPRHIARLIVDYFAYAVRPGASAPRTAHRAARRVACRRLLRLRRVSRCLVTSRGS